MSAPARVTFRIDRPLWDVYWRSAASTGLYPAAVLAAILTAWAAGDVLPERPAARHADPIGWGSTRNATMTADSAWWAALHTIGAAAGYSRAGLIDRACRWWLRIDTLPPAPPLQPSATVSRTFTE